MHHEQQLDEQQQRERQQSEQRYAPPRDVQAEMKIIREGAQQRHDQHAVAQSEESRASELAREEVSAIWNAAGRDYVTADPDRLTLTSKPGGTGFSVEYEPPDLNAPGTWNLPIFDVTVTVTATVATEVTTSSTTHPTAAVPHRASADTAPQSAQAASASAQPAPHVATDVTVAVKDGSWAYKDNVLGNWGNWANEKPAYKGPIDDKRIRAALDKAFLAWYRRVVWAQ